MDDVSLQTSSLVSFSFPNFPLSTMATFLPGVTDSRPEQHLYQPDYNFLGSVMGAEQQKYDEGFSKVKTIYSSLLNGAISNGQNREWRDDAFKKIETQMRSVSKVDLRQGANVNKAQNIFAPLVVMKT